jgi:hypothetical protein
MRLVLPFVLAGLAGAWHQQPGSPSTQTITLVIAIDKTQFAPAATLNVRVWNAEQLAILDRNARCATVSDPQSRVTRLQCPDGIEYQQVTPEQFDYPIASLGRQLEVSTRSVRVGERARIRLSGLYRDKCNTVSAELVLEARSVRTPVGNVRWQATAKACLEGAIL